VGVVRRRRGNGAEAVRKRCGSGAEAVVLAVRAGVVQTYAVRPRCGSGAEAVRKRCGSGEEAVRKRCGSGAEAVQLVYIPGRDLASLRDNSPGLMLHDLRHLWQFWTRRKPRRCCRLH
jgi:hypothetical protein